MKADADVALKLLTSHIREFSSVLAGHIIIKKINHDDPLLFFLN